VDITNSKKQELRKRFRAERSLRDLTESWTHIIKSEEFQSAKTIASYISYGDEPATKELNEEILRNHKKLVLPRMLKDKNLEWVVWNGDQSKLTKAGKIARAFFLIKKNICAAHAIFFWPSCVLDYGAQNAPNFF